MGLSRIKSMAQPTAEWWQTLLIWVKDNTILFMIFALVWKGIDKVFKYFSEARDAELRKIVKDEMSPLSTAIDELRESIWALKNKL